MVSADGNRKEQKKSVVAKNCTVEIEKNSGKALKGQVIYKIRQRLLFFFLPRECPLTPSSPPTARSMPRLKRSSTPSPRFDEHSRYSAFILVAVCMPCCVVTGDIPWALSSSKHVRFDRRSVLSPTRTSGVLGQKWRTSGYHCILSVVKPIAR